MGKLLFSAAILILLSNCGSPKISVLEQARIDSISAAKLNVDHEESAPKNKTKLSFIEPGSYGVKLANKLEYLNQLEEVKWFEIDNNDVYIGFANIEDMRQICNAAAFLGNKEIDFGCHVYALDANKHSSSKSAQEYIYTVTYRHGQKQ